MPDGDLPGKAFDDIQADDQNDHDADHVGDDVEERVVVRGFVGLGSTAGHVEIVKALDAQHVRAGRATSDETGSFLVQHLESGTYEIFVTHVGYHRLHIRSFTLVAGEATAGTVSTVGESLTVGAPVALAMVRREVADGDTVAVRWDSGSVPGLVHDLPLDDLSEISHSSNTQDRD